MAKILVTGSTGLVGSNLVSRLVANGQAVRVLNRIGAKHPSLKGLPIEVFHGCITDAESINPAFDGIDVLYHCAGKISYLKQEKESLYNINVCGTKNVLKSALVNGVERVVHLSSVSAISQVGDYGRSKKESENICEDFIEKGLDIVIAQPSVVYGAGDIKGNSSYPFRRVCSSKFAFVPPGGKSYIHVDDLVTGLELLTTQGEIGEKYIFSNQNLTFLQLYQLIKTELGKSTALVSFPKGIKPVIKFLSTFSKYNPEALQAVFEKNYYSNVITLKSLDWKPEKPIALAIRQMQDFYEENEVMSGQC